MTTIKVSELEGAQLDYWVGRAVGVTVGPYQMAVRGKPMQDCHIMPAGYPTLASTQPFQFSTNWAHGGPIIDREIRVIGHNYNGPGWLASVVSEDGTIYQQAGSEPLIAAMRAVVASKFGQVIEVAA